MYSEHGGFTIEDAGEGHQVACYEIDTSPGNEGSPLHKFKGTEFSVLETVGIHSGIQGLQTYGTIFTKKILDNFILPTLQQYKQQMEQITGE